VRAADSAGGTVESVRKIWDEAAHNAFTDLVRFDSRWYCVFREGAAHVSADGAIRVLTSADGEKWETAAVIRSAEGDLRDPKICVTPGKELMLTGAEAIRKGSDVRHQTYVWFSTDGKSWGERVRIGDPDYWLWRVTWHKSKAYGVGYATRRDGERDPLRLYQSTDGKEFERLKDKLFDQGAPNETSLIFLEDDTCYCLLRRDGTPNNALLGTASPPYTEWDWKDLGKRIGGPHMVRLPDGRIVAAVRLLDGKARTSLCWLDPKAGTLDEFVKLPSGGDTSYAGLVWHDERLWVSYYSSHEGKTSIYLAKVRLDEVVKTGRYPSRASGSNERVPADSCNH
jgi:hypothetical protein